LAGLFDITTDTTSHRQTGGNFGGMYYTLHRHYDPVLMRFTSPDPLAAPFYNLYHYAGNSPHAYFDPDGLEGISFSFSGYWGRAGRILTKGEFEFGLSLGGYGARADATWTGAAFSIVDVATLGQYYTDTDRLAMYSMYADQGLGGYFNAGGFVGSTTVLTAMSIATAGAFAGVGIGGNVAHIGLRSFMAGGAISGAYGGAADAGIAGGGAGDMLAGAAIGAVIGAGSELLGAVGGRLISRGLHKVGDKLLGNVTPHGFVNSSDFARFINILNRGMKKAGYGDAKGMMRGSSVTGVGHTGAPFDVGRLSDLDIAIASPSLMRQARSMGVGIRGGGTRTQPLAPEQLEALGLLQLKRKLSRYVRGRDVSFMAYENIPAILNRGPAIPFGG